MPLVQPPEAVARDDFVLGKSSGEALAGRRRDGFAFPILRFLNTGEFKHRRHDVDDVRGGVAQFAFREDAPRPVRDQWRADRSFMHPRFVAAMWSIARAGKTGT